MKRLIGLLAVFVLIVTVPHIVYAAPARIAQKPTVTPAVTPTPTAPPKVEYDLPYPGILPTHPLYFMKNFRDRIIEMLITDPVSKAEFYLLQSDKKVGMGLMLKSAKDAKAAQTAFTEAAAAHDTTITLLESQKKAGRAIPDHTIDKLTLSLAKHREVLSDSGESVDAVTRQEAKVREIWGER